MLRRRFNIQYKKKSEKEIKEIEISTNWLIVIIVIIIVVFYTILILSAR